MMTILHWLGVVEAPPTDEPTSRAVVLFMAGHSIPRIAAVEHPGVGGPALIDAQRQIEDDIRSYISELLETIAELQSAVQ